MLVVRVMLVRVYENLNYVDRFSKNPQISKFHENPSSGSRTVPRGQVNMAKLIVAYRIFANALKEGALLLIKRGGFALILSRQHVRIKDCCYLREETFVRHLVHGAEDFVGTDVF
jgi:hypothetical protein